MPSDTYIGRDLPLKLPDGKTMAVWLCPNVESFALDKSVPGGSGHPYDLSPWSIREYGNRAGIWRIAKLLEDLHLIPTVALNSDICKLHPEIIEHGDSQDWEWMGHGVTNSDFSHGLDEKAEQEQIATSLDVISQHTRMRPTGWLTPHFAQNRITPHLLKEQGVEYVADWMVDDRVCSLNFDEGMLVILPYSLEVNDKSCYQGWKMTPKEYADHVCTTFDQLHRESLDSPVTFVLPMHTYLSGYPGRIQATRAILEHILSFKESWFATGSQIVDSIEA